MATTPQGDDSDVRYTVMQSLARAVARQRMVARQPGRTRPARKLSAIYTNGTAPKLAPR
jgi:hypothetical protein